MRHQFYPAGFLALILILLSGQLSAHGPTRQKVVEKVEINATAEQVWAVIGDFGNAHSWLPMVESTTSEGGNAPGAKRVLNLVGGAKVYETLKNHDDAKMKYSYRIPVDTHDVNILPVNNYSSTISVKASGDNCTVTWKSGFYRGYPNNDPPPELNDEAAVAAVSELYKAGLAHLKKVVEGQ